MSGCEQRHEDQREEAIDNANEGGIIGAVWNGDQQNSWRCCKGGKIHGDQ